MPADGRKVLLETQHISVDFNGFQALTDINIKVYEGELRVIIGPNGAGKTTFMDIVTGRTHPTEGKVFFNGANITALSPSDIAAKYKIGRKFQGPNVFDNMTVMQNIEIAMCGYHSLTSCLFFHRSKDFLAKLDATLEAVDLYDYRAFLACDLSHGQRQWLEIGMVLAQDPALIILDEPTAGMTVDETYKTGEMIKRLKGNHTLIAVEHDMDFVRQVAEYVTVLDYGKLLAEGTMEEIQNNSDVIAVYLKED